MWPAAVLLTLVLLGGGGYLVVAHSPLLAADEVRVRGTVTLTPAQITEVARVPIGTPMARLDLAAVRARVEAIPKVARADVTRDWPHTVRITVAERTAVGVFPEGPRFAEFDAEGVRFATTDDRPPGLPLVRVDPERATAATLKDVADVIAAAPRAVLDRLVEITPRTRDDIILTLDKGVSVDWGGAQDSRQKAVVLAALMNVRAKVYDVSVPDAPVTRNTPVSRDVPPPAQVPVAAQPAAPSPPPAPAPLPGQVPAHVPAQVPAQIPAQVPAQGDASVPAAVPSPGTAPVVPGAVRAAPG